MSRRGFSSIARSSLRAAAQVQRARERATRQEHAARLREARFADRQAKADAKDAARAYTAARVEETEDMSTEIAERDTAISTVLTRALSRHPRMNFAAMRQTFQPSAFDETNWRMSPPERAHFQPAKLGFFARLGPGAMARQARLQEDADGRYEEFKARYAAHLEGKASAVRRHEEAEREKEDAVNAHNESVRRLEHSFLAGDHETVVFCYDLLIKQSLDGEFDALSAEVGYSPSSRQLVVDLELPDLDAVSEESSFKYVKTADRIDPVMRPVAKRRALYASFIQQIVLKCLDTVFRGSGAAVDVVTINGMLDTVDPATGQQIRPCLVSVKVTSDAFAGLKLSHVQPDQCLRSLRASVSSSPAELVAVKPIVELDMVDPRFIESRDVLSELDTRPNLMDLTPSEFENLITNLFAKMGLETKQTQASRDGGVDCVAFDLRPILGGKVVIQAKRYKNTVGVSAVRDLYGTMQNEGANRGILVTTSGYGKASSDFAKGKPLELIDGGGLLHLLAEHAGIEARIVVPESWTDRSNSWE